MLIMTGMAGCGVLFLTKQNGINLGHMGAFLVPCDILLC